MADETVIIAATVATAVATVVIAAFAAWQVVREFYSARTMRNLASKEKAFEQINRHVFDSKIVELIEHWRIIKAKYDNNEVDFDSIYHGYQRHKEYAKDSGSISGSSKHDYDYVIQLLNFYELISIGIRRKTIDEASYKEWWRTAFVLDWINAEKFVKAFREKKHAPNAYVNFEFVAVKWKRPEDEKAAREM